MTLNKPLTMMLRTKQSRSIGNATDGAGRIAVAFDDGSVLSVAGHITAIALGVVREVVQDRATLAFENTDGTTASVALAGNPAVIVRSRWGAVVYAD